MFAFITFPGSLWEQQGVTSVTGNSSASTAPKENQHREGGERVIKSILLNHEAHQSRSSTAVQSQQKIKILSSESGKRPPRAVSARLVSNGLASQSELNSFGSEGDTKRTPEDKFTKKIMPGLGNVSEKQEKRTRNRDRPDRGVWTPLHRSDLSHASDDRLSPPVSHSTHSLSDSVEGTAITLHGPMSRCGFYIGEPSVVSTCRSPYLRLLMRGNAIYSLFTFGFQLLTEK